MILRIYNPPLIHLTCYTLRSVLKPPDHLAEHELYNCFDPVTAIKDFSISVIFTKIILVVINDLVMHETVGFNQAD